jgi:hypothetical protein
MTGMRIRHHLRLAARRRAVSVVLALGALTLGALGLLAQAPSTGASRIADVDRVIVRDAAGRVRIELTVLADGSPTLGLLDREGVPRVVLGLAPDGTPALALLGRDARGAQPSTGREGRPRDPGPRGEGESPARGGC